MFFEHFTAISTDISVRIAMPVYNLLFGAGQRWFFAYLAVAVLSAALILYARHRDPTLGVAGNVKQAFKRLFAREVLLHPSAQLDYRYAVINHVLTSAVLVYLLLAINVASQAFYDFFGLFPVLQDSAVTVGWIGAAGIVLLYAFAYDTANFFQHYAQHKVPILWEFHKVHHSAEVLTPVTAVRMHPVAQVVHATVSALVYGLLNGFMYNVFSGETAQWSLFGANIFALLFYTVGLYHLKHSHVWFTYPAVIRDIFASPSLHLIHHSNDPKHYDKNFGFVFTFWDRLFGSFYDPHDSEEDDLVLGISESEGRDDYMTVRDLYLTPFKRAWHLHIKPWWDARRGVNELRAGE